MAAMAMILGNKHLETRKQSMDHRSRVKVETDPSMEVVETAEKKSWKLLLVSRGLKEARSRTITDGSSWS
ncbi:unnamed protein product [Sphagnum balticum]